MNEMVFNYRAKVWQAPDSKWEVKVLRNDVYFNSSDRFESREEALDWAREIVERDKAHIVAERGAESVTL